MTTLTKTIICSTVILLSCDTNAAVTDHSNEKALFVITNSSFTLSPELVEYDIQYNYDGEIGFWRSFSIWAANDTNSFVGILRANRSDTPNVRDPINSISGSRRLNYSAPGSMVWIFISFSGDIYDSTATGLEFRKSFSFRDSVLLKVQGL
jgi:hypothetical protein